MMIALCVIQDAFSAFICDFRVMAGNYNTTADFLLYFDCPQVHNIQHENAADWGQVHIEPVEASEDESC